MRVRHTGRRSLNAEHLEAGAISVRSLSTKRLPHTMVISSSISIIPLGAKTKTILQQPLEFRAERFADRRGWDKASRAQLRSGDGPEVSFGLIREHVALTCKACFGTGDRCGSDEGNPAPLSQHQPIDVTDLHRCSSPFPFVL